MTDEELEKVARAVRQFDEMTYADFMDAATPKVVISLLERVRKAEARVEELEETCIAAHRELFLGGGSAESGQAAEAILAKTAS